MVVIFIFSTGCNTYDYRTDTPTGNTNTAGLIKDEVITNNYDGVYTSVIMSPVNTDSAIYVDNNISVIHMEKRYSKALITVYINSVNLLNNFTIEFEYFDKDYKSLGAFKTEPQMVVGGFYASLLIELPENSTYLKLVNYSGDNLGEITNITISSFKDSDILEQQSNTTYYSNADLDDITIFLTEDGRVIAGYKQITKGTFIIERNYINNYGIVEVN